MSSSCVNHITLSIVNFTMLYVLYVINDVMKIKLPTDDVKPVRAQSMQWFIIPLAK